MDASNFNEWVTLGSSVAAAAGSFYMGIKWTRKRLLRFVEIPELLKDIAKQIEFLDARQQITCRRIGIGIYVCNAIGACTYVSQFLADIWGMDASALLGSGWIGQVSEQHETLHHWEFAVKNRLHYRANYTVENAVTGKKVRIHTEAVYIANGIGGFVGFVEIVPMPKELDPVNR